MIRVELNDYLDKIVSDFFSNDCSWNSHWFKREDSISEDNLPCHLREVDWLTSLMIEKYGLALFSREPIARYVKESLYFNQLRSEYEQRIVKWQIEWMKQGEETLEFDTYDDDSYLFSIRCDYIFRKGIVDTLLAVGMDSEAIEEGIEKNACLWRDAYMHLAFKNQFDKSFAQLDYKKNGNIQEQEKIDLEFKENWIRYRKYQYYQEHKNSIDTYSAPTSEMLLTPEEALQLKLYLETVMIQYYKKTKLIECSVPQKKKTIKKFLNDFYTESK